VSLRKSLFALMYDRMSRKSEDAGVRAMREGLLAEAGGRVLEIGGGTGANLPHYGEGVESLVLTEPEPAMLRRLQSKAHEQAPLAKVVQAPAEDLPFADDSFDTVVSTLVLCGVDDQEQALREVRRVLQPGGRFLFLEHVRSDDPDFARFQDRMNWLNRLVVNCDCNRSTLAGIEGAGFTVSHLEQTTLPKAPKFVRPLIVGAAVGRRAAREGEGGAAAWGY
jgi:ubiquinone/menaquinone biosynthesis C-methylase UbiE